MVGVSPGTCCGTANCVVCSVYVGVLEGVTGCSRVTPLWSLDLVSSSTDHHSQNRQSVLLEMTCIGNQYALVIDATILSQTHKHNFMLKMNHIESTTAVTEQLVFYSTMWAFSPRWANGWVKPLIMKVLQFNMFWMIQSSGDWNLLIYRICKLCELTSLAQKLLHRSIWWNLHRLHAKC